VASSRSANSTAAPQGRAARDWVELGRVLRSHGLDGSLLVALHSDDPTNLIAARELRLAGEPGTIPFRVVHAESAGQGPGGRARVRLELAGLENRERAQLFAGAAVLVAEAGLQPLPEGEFYWRDLLGLRALGRDGAELGTLVEIVPTAGADVFVLRRPSGPDLLLPATDALILKVDRERSELWLDPPAELLAEGGR